MKKLAIAVPAMFIVCAGGAYVEMSRRHDAAIQTRLVAFDGRDGTDEAQLDIGRGMPKWKIAGLESADLEYRAVLRDRFGVSLDRIADCDVNTATLRYVEAYNAKIRVYLSDKHGAPALQRALADAEAMSYARRKKKG
jgi:hypothetical protein